ncbi:hypothetical protein PGN35_002550 [Nodosilinea sp. PGN35]|uniref:hypothetical protein n=1 Tax=Nodosilinea sp. PGN35 TaxID=3020489 RepID=UPI0023B352BC|nr:hypothetical protein [Nodosilinea sp. TSF1-S3]MDF0365499.1 hypothetical protein [Nodosilinea sp. TSF1-S3]
MSELTISQPWDMAGADGLVAARALFGETVDHLAPFQSMETALEGEACSVLRLCDRNFRVTYPGPLDRLVAALHLRVWVRQLDWLGAIALPAANLPAIAALATVRAPHRLSPLPLHRAVPAQVTTIAVLVWHHPEGESAVVELHLARHQITSFLSLIQPSNHSSVSLTTAHT